MGEVESSGARRFMRRHWLAITLFAIAFVLLIAESVFVFLWFVRSAQVNSLVPSTLGFWSMANLVTFILNAAFWELLLVGIPVVAAGIAGWLWWKGLPLEEKTGYHVGNRAKWSGGGGGTSLFFFILFCIKVYLDGNWNIPIATWNLDYVVGSMVLILEYVLVIFGVLAAIALVWWLSRGAKVKTSGPAV